MTKLLVAAGTAAGGVLAYWLLMLRRKKSEEVVPLDVRLGLTKMDSPGELRWLFMGAGRVAHDFANALKCVEGARLYSVATASDLERASRFAERHGFAKAHGSYSTALRDPQVDVVYLSAMHSRRVEHVTQILNAGKHAVVEKPFACSLADAEKLFALAKEKNLFLMEGMWTRYFPAVEKARDLIESKAVGEVTAVLSDFGFDASDSGAYPKNFDDPRDGDPIYHASIGGGALLWAGPYPIAAGFLPFGGDVEPTSVVAAGVADAGNTNVELSASIALSYPLSDQSEREETQKEGASGCPPRGATVSCFTGIDSETRETTCYVGRKGRIVVDTPGHCPTRLQVQIKRPGRGTTDDFTFDYPLPSSRNFAKTPSGEYFNYPNSEGFAYEAAAVQRCITAGLKECPQYTTNDCLRTMKIIQTARNAIVG